MPRPRKPQDDRRTCHVGVRLRQAQRRKLRAKAAALGISVSAFIAAVAEDTSPSRPLVVADPDLAPIALLVQWQRIGNNVNQIARALNRGRDPDAAEIVDTLQAVIGVMIEDQLARRYALRLGHLTRAAA